LSAGESTAGSYSFDQARRDEISWDKSKPWETNVEMEVKKRASPSLGETDKSFTIHQ
jgi:hypothetical protein